ncbi:uncharacterized protein DC041_0012857 [Schistosoma bovis]|uniref:Tetraspanin n=1 Tax=Schistosoma bovis TaxID=6184 RepID=A0A430Q9E6_SCHBO|nr:uncharacterized protein DC041_0012857 [Schistosoma bovis]
MTKITFTSCFKCLKYSMFVFCLIAWVLGLITFIVGIVARVNGSFGILDAHIPAVHAGANLLIAVGFFIMIMGFFGCCGAIRESQCLLFLVNHYMYRYLEEQVTRYRETEPENESTKLMDFIQKKVNHYMYRYLEEQVTRYRETEPENESTKLMDFIQKKFGCCGVTSAADYGTRSPPKSCTVTKSIQSYSRGCHEVLVEACRSNLSVICGIGISFALILVS